MWGWSILEGGEWSRTSHPAPAGGSWLCERCSLESTSGGGRRSAGTCATDTPQNPLARSSSTQARWCTSLRGSRAVLGPLCHLPPAAHFAHHRLKRAALSRHWAVRCWRRWTSPFSLSSWGRSRSVRNGRWTPAGWGWCLWTEGSSWKGELNTPGPDSRVVDFRHPASPSAGRAALNTGCPGTECPAAPLAGGGDRNISYTLNTSPSTPSLDVPKDSLLSPEVGEGGGVEAMMLCLSQ